MTVAFLCTTPLILNIINHPKGAVLIAPLILFAFFFMFTRELIKDIEDEPGDFRQGILTFPVLVGIRKASIFAIISMIFSLHTLVLPVIIGIYSPLFIVFSGIPVTLLMIQAILRVKKKLFKASQNFIKLAILAGIVGLILSQRVLVFY
jgi:4-hydroxybenzoate polyprenyltransferase